MSEYIQLCSSELTQFVIETLQIFTCAKDTNEGFLEYSIHTSVTLKIRRNLYELSVTFVVHPNKLINEFKVVNKFTLVFIYFTTYFLISK